jgi:phosphatidylglycerophosphatase A
MNLKLWVAMGLGSGRSPVAPGTTGTLGVLPLVVLMWEQSEVWWCLGLLLLVALNYWSVGEAGHRLGQTDHGQIVIDEWVGMWIAAFGIQYFTELGMVTGVALGFIGFRLFDIYKPWPVSWCERSFSGTTGVLLDDVAAGVYVLVLTGLSAMMLGFGWPGAS